MVYAVTHVLIPMVLVDLVRDHLIKKKKILPNKFVLVAGIAGLLPDTDLLISYFLGLSEFHRTLTHSIWFPLAFFAIFSYFYFINKKPFYWKLFLMVFIGFSIHIILDYTVSGAVSLLYPLNADVYGLNLVPVSQASFVYPALDSILLIFWLVHEEWEHKISDYF